MLSKVSRTTPYSATDKRMFFYFISIIGTILTMIYANYSQVQRVRDELDKAPKYRIMVEDTNNRVKNLEVTLEEMKKELEELRRK